MHTQPGRSSWILALLIPLAACAAKTHRVRPDARCDAPVPISYSTPVLNVTHVFTGPDGLSHSELQRDVAQSTTYLGASLQQFQLGDPANVIVMTGPPNFLYPKHPAPYREIYFVLAGSMTIELSDGTEPEVQAGSLVLFEDVTGAGHGGQFGHCGFVAMDLQYRAQAAPASH
jgi:mannose-6-phosphate isomerase-like protein (cupin superfamily)